MGRYRLIGDYGSFTIERLVEATDAEAAWAETGIYTTLEAAGWRVTDSEDAEWTIIDEATGQVADL
jgi:hypothetical protein